LAQQNEDADIPFWMPLIIILVSIGITLAIVKYADSKYKQGYNEGISKIRSADMSELASLRQVMQSYPSSIIVINCEQQEKIKHKLRKRKKIGNTRVSDTIYYTGECK
jgi:hypothetical protein